MLLYRFGKHRLVFRATFISTMALPKSFYCRELPKGLVDYRSNESKLRLTRSLTLGSAVPFLSLSSCFNTQAEPAYCGLSTLAIVLNALRIDPQRIWKTPWRWFTEDLLDCCRPLDVVKKVGITMDEFLCLAKCNGAVCTLTRPEDNEQSYQLFRKSLFCVCYGGSSKNNNILSCCVSEKEDDTNCPQDTTHGDEENPNEFLVISYDRKKLQQTGTGHFSPVAAFDQETDSVLLFDTARFKYPPYWVPVRLLFESMLPVDPSTGKNRGYFVLKARSEVQGRKVCCLWKELLAATDESHRCCLPEPHPVYDSSTMTCHGKDSSFCCKKC
ncbi:glutathione gamma-glutamylcysteinyltransferase 2 [Nematostella vectensis]|uniref:glutathione gamma-glutamylcysteinyltransferase 2 n=1 Tax=Nematostella vectensis TaxID=45351 RepID=UPI00138FDF8C|nr:glutathione gamma-glutamylcysteinyltransferase 2 [Nematostella vectensis]